MGTKRAKGGRLAPGVLKVRRAPGTLASAHRPARACRVFVDTIYVYDLIYFPRFWEACLR